MDNSSNMSFDNRNNTFIETDNNSQYVSPLSGPGFLVFNVVMLLAVVLPVIAANTVLLVALVLESSTVKVVRLVLGSMLVSCLLAALGLAMYHISGIILNRSPVRNPPAVPCTITLFLIDFGGAARLEFVALFAVVVYIVKSGRDTKKNTFIAVLVAVATLWVFAFLGNSPLLSQDTFSTGYGGPSCSLAGTGEHSYIIIGLFAFFFGLVPLCVTIIVLAITACFIKYHSFTDIQAKTAMVKFAFFLLFGNIVYWLGLFVPAIIAIYPTIDSAEGRIYTAYTLLNSALIPTPILILIYFKPIRKKLWNWWSCWMLKKRMANHMSKHSSNVGGSGSASGPEKAMKEV